MYLNKLLKSYEALNKSVCHSCGVNFPPLTFSSKVGIVLTPVHIIACVLIVIFDIAKL